MSKIADKLNLILKRFFIIAVCFIVGYTFLNWLLFIKAEIPLKEDIVKFWLPFGLPFIPVYIWLRPRIKLLQFNNDNGSFVYQFIASLAIAIPTIVAQDYLTSATGKLTALENISQIEKSEKTKYYRIKDFFIDKQHVAIQHSASVSGKHNRDFNMNIYVAMPIRQSVADRGKADCEFWLGKLYTERISNNLSDFEKDVRYRAFAEQSERQFEIANFNHFNYLEVIGNNDDHDEYNKAIEKSGLANGKKPIVFEGQNEPFEKRNGKTFEWIFGSFGIGLLFFFLLLLFPKFQEKQLEDFRRGLVKKDNSFKEDLDILVPKEGYFITPILVNLNLLAFIIMVFSGFGFISFKGGDLLNWGANFRPATVNDSQWWRLLTSCFLHGGLMHVLANMYGLLFVGIFLEPILGKTKYLLIYLATGIIASIASILWYDATISVGASGAIFGLYGFFLAALLLKVFPPDFGKAFLLSTVVFIGFNLLMDIMGGIDNAAHIGGLVSGFLIGLIMSTQLKQQIEIFTSEEEHQNSN